MNKIISLLVIMLLTFQLTAQPKVINIHGDVNDTSIRTIKITYPTDGELSKWDSKVIAVANGVFSASFQLPFPTNVGIAYGNRYFDKNYIFSDVNILIDTAGDLQITGSPWQSEYENEFAPFIQSNEKVYDSLMSFYRRYGGEFQKIVNDSVILFRERYGLQRADLLYEYIKLHPNSYIALWDIRHFASIPASYKYFDFEKLFSSFSQQMQQGSFMNALKEKIALSNRLQPGQVFPEEFFKGYEQTKNVIKENCRFYLIDFWYSHCGPCIAEFPRLKEIYNRFKSKGFNILSISIDTQQDEKDYRIAIQKYDLPWSHIWDKDGALSKKFNVNSFPTYILLDKDDRIIQYGIKTNQLEAFLKEKL